MSDSELAVVAPQTFQAPILIERAGPSTRKKFFEFFTVPIRNANTRAAYYRAIQQFLAWAERAGYQDLEDIEPITVAAYIETLQRQAAAPTVKQHMAAIRMLLFLAHRKRVPLSLEPKRTLRAGSPNEFFWGIRIAKRPEIASQDRIVHCEMVASKHVKMLIC